MSAASRSARFWALTVTWVGLGILNTMAVGVAVIIVLAITGRALIGFWTGGLAGVPEPNIDAIKALVVVAAAAVATSFGRVAIEDAMERDLPDSTP